MFTGTQYDFDKWMTDIDSRCDEFEHDDTDEFFSNYRVESEDTYDNELDNLEEDDE